MSETKELKDNELEQAVGGLNVFSDDNTITMIFSASDKPSEMLFSIKNHIDRQLGCLLETSVSNALQNILNDMSNTGKTYLKINYTKNSEFITDISVNVIF